MKKLTALLMGLVMLLSLAACSSESPSGSSSTPESSAPESSQASEPGSESAQAPEIGKTLVVYYSATGNTETAANYIAEATGGDLFELEPANPYTDADLNLSLIHI